MERRYEVLLHLVRHLDRAVRWGRDHGHNIATAAATTSAIGVRRSLGYDRVGRFDLRYARGAFGGNGVAAFTRGFALSLSLALGRYRELRIDGGGVDWFGAVGDGQRRLLLDGWCRWLLEKWRREDAWGRGWGRG